MLSIINAFPENGDSIDLYDLQKASRACTSDTFEVTHMIAYLTHFGQISRNDKGWVRLHKKRFLQRDPRRKYYLNGLLVIINTLNSKSQTIAEISKKTDFNKILVENYLIFLKKLTEKGIITKNKDQSNEKWSVSRLSISESLL